MWVGQLGIFVFLASSILSEAVAICSEKPQLYLHKRTSVRPIVDSDQWVTLTDLTREYITCRASQNVEWVYEGDGEPSKFQESAAVQINRHNDDGFLEYCITSRASFYAKQSDTDLAKHSGRYICREIGNTSNSASVHVFVGRRNAPVYIQSRKIISLSLSHENLTEPSSFVIPCSTSSPSVHSSLYWKQSGGLQSSNNFQKIYATHDASGESNSTGLPFTATFDPRYGFHIHTTSKQNLSFFYGDYKCVGKPSSAKSSSEMGMDDDDFVIFQVAAVPAFRAYPPESAVYTSGILNLTCEWAEEPVIMKEVKVRPHYDQYSYDDNEDSDDEHDVRSNSVEDVEETVVENKLHVANYVDNNPLPGSYGEIQCLAEKDKRVLHSWQYRILGKREEKLSGIKFNKREGAFSCRSKSGIPGKLSFVSCRTPSECSINGICLQKSENCRGYSNATKALCHRGNRFCGKIFYKGGSGLIRCVGDGIDQIRGYTDEAKDGKLRMGFHKLKPSETVHLSMKRENKSASLDLNEGLLEEEEVRLSLKLGYYYFLQPVQWTLKLSNGTSIELPPKTLSVEKTRLHRTVHVQLKMPELDTAASHSQPGKHLISSIVGINALIPLRSSVPPSWKTITLPVKVTSENISENEDDIITDNERHDEVEGSGAGMEGRSDLQLEDERTTEYSQLQNVAIVADDGNGIIEETVGEQNDGVHTEISFDGEVTTQIYAGEEMIPKY